ncbi:MAG: WYL domain-containing protein [Microthrixaceae bacterium]|nr:WYL domain-containing protein [Microthrixaceae bacterium]
MNKLERLLNLTAALLHTRRPLTAEDIRNQIPGYPPKEESFRRAFERDKDDLREMGIPIELVEILDHEVPVMGYRIPPERYYLPDPGLSAEELAALQLAATSFRLGEGGVDLDAVRKLGGREEGSTPEVELATIPRPAHLDVLFEAVTLRRVVTFDYGGDGREVEPYRLDFHKGRWYLTGRDRSRDGDRRFRLDRIEGDVEVGHPDAFQRPTHVAGRRPEPWELGEGDPLVARLLIDAHQAPLARHQLPDDIPWQQRPDGSAIATIGVVNVAGFRSFVLQFLHHAEILDPPELRSDIQHWIQDVITRG